MPIYVDYLTRVKMPPRSTCWFCGIRPAEKPLLYCFRRVVSKSEGDETWNVMRIEIPSCGPCSRVEWLVLGGVALGLSLLLGELLLCIRLDVSADTIWAVMVGSALAIGGLIATVIARVARRLGYRWSARESYPPLLKAIEDGYKSASDPDSYGSIVKYLCREVAVFPDLSEGRVRPSWRDQAP